MFIYPSNLKAKPKLWLWELRDVVAIAVALVLSVLAAVAGLGGFPLVVTVMFAFLSVRVEGTSVLDYLRYAAGFLFLEQQYFEWRQRI